MTTTPTIEAPDGRTAAAPWRANAERVLRVTSAGILAGLVSGFLFGAVGGRIAMRIVTLQTDDHLMGLRTDDSARTGEISLGGSLGLAAFVTLLGVAGALVYLVVRELVPASRRALTFGALTGVAGGALVVHSDGVDFTVLGVPWVSVAMFVGVLAGYGWATSRVAERLLRPGGIADSAPLSRLALSLIVLVPGLLFVPVGAAVAAVVAARTSGVADRLHRGAVLATGRVVLLAMAAVAAVDLTRTLIEL